MEGSNAWWDLFDLNVPNMELNTVNHYGTDGSYYTGAGATTSSFFWAYRSSKPVLITEYGVDAFQVKTYDGSNQ